ncbi:MAG: hypothetical protein IJL55_08285 [Lachnospiraceae bacterium]|nr:hypothetical protein [Lachnospiraceae bacterium]
MNNSDLKVRFHLPGLRYNYPLNMFWISMLETHPEYFRDNIEIASIFGSFPFSLWNGGRLIINDQCDADFVKTVIKSINAKGIPVRYTFTNPVLEEEDLADPFCNFCMKAADNGMNEVLVFSPILEEYIRKNYPAFKIDSTTCKEIKDENDLNAELAKDYKYVVLDYNLNNRWDMIERLSDPGRLEVLVNAVCVPACPRRGEHYRYIGEMERKIAANRKLSPEKQERIVDNWSCEYGEYNNLYTIKDYKTFVSPEMIYNEYLPRGINNFKIEGRTANLFSLIETYCYFMIKPEYSGQVRILLLNNLANAKIITVNKPRPTIFKP